MKKLSPGPALARRWFLILLLIGACTDKPPMVPDPDVPADAGAD